MKKRGIFFVLFLLCGLLFSVSVFSRTEETNEIDVRNIILEDNTLDLSYYEEKYDIYNEENVCFKIKESYPTSSEVLGKNSIEEILQVEFYAYVNKEEQYFIFGYEGKIKEEVAISSIVRVEIVEYEGNYYFISSNGYATPYEEAIEENIKANCFSQAIFGETIGLGGLSGFSDIRVGGSGGIGGYVGVGTAIGIAAGVAIGASINNNCSVTNTPSLPLPGIKTPQSSEDTSKDSESSSDIPKVDVEDLPENAQESFKKYDKAGWEGNVSGQTEKTKAGRNWKNNKDQLPKTDEEGNPITYKEYDVNNKVGDKRDTERFIRGSDGSVYYTDSHYGDVESKYGFPPFVKLK